MMVTIDEIYAIKNQPINLGQKTTFLPKFFCVPLVAEESKVDAFLLTICGLRDKTLQARAH